MKLASIFTNNMLLQRDMPIRIFGEGKGRAEIIFLGEKKSINSINEKWCITFPAHKYGGPYEMKINLDGKKIILSNILIGDVWLVCGQSNMELPMVETEEGYENSLNVYDENIRYFSVPKRFKKDEFDKYSKDTPWKICDFESTVNFSAIGHYFAKMLKKEINVPVGIISCNWGGRKIDAFIEKKYFDEEIKLKKDAEDFFKYTSTLDMEQYEKKFKYDLHKREEFLDTIPSNVDFIKKFGLRGGINRRTEKLKGIPGFDTGPYDGFSPATLWDAMFSRIIPYGVKGMLWYQGESNRKDKNYFEKYRAFLKCIRENFQNDMPVYAVELAQFYIYWDENLKPLGSVDFFENSNWAIIREAQQKAVRELENNYLATAFDLGEILNIHPFNKKEVATRLFKKVLKYTYNKKDILADQPVFKKAEFIDDKIYISFENDEGMEYSNLEFVNMYIADETRELKLAELYWEGKRLVLHNSEVKHPMYVIYGFDDFYMGKFIYNDAGLPLSSFRAEKGFKQC